MRGEEGERRGGEGGKRGVKYVEFLINPTSITRALIGKTNPCKYRLNYMYIYITCIHNVHT